MSITCLVIQTKNNIALCENAFSSNEASDRPFSIRATSFNKMEESWKDIKGYEGYYQVSNFGRVKSLSREVIMNRFDCSYIIKEKIIKPCINNKNGYVYVGLHINTKLKTKSVHRLVAEAFISNPHKKKTVNHISGVKTKNEASNLEWTTYSENGLHSFRVLNRARPMLGIPSVRRKAIQQIHPLTHMVVATFPSLTHAAISMNASPQSICDALKGRSKVCKKYNWRYEK